MTTQLKQAAQKALEAMPKADEPLILQSVVRALEQEAINLYRVKHPDGPLWQELASATRHVWVTHAEQKRQLGEPK